MQGFEIVVTASAGLNLIIVSLVVINSYRIGKITGSLKNGGYLKCPFFRGHIDDAVKGQHEDTKR